jgi:hypothetical protein
MKNLMKDSKKIPHIAISINRHKVMDKFQPLYFPNIRSFITSFKHNVGTRGPMDNILLLNSRSPSDYI